MKLYLVHWTFTNIMIVSASIAHFAGRSRFHPVVKLRFNQESGRHPPE
jgi:hypothetical protein